MSSIEPILSFYLVTACILCGFAPLLDRLLSVGRREEKGTPPRYRDLWWWSGLAVPLIAAIMLTAHVRETLDRGWRNFDITSWEWAWQTGAVLFVAGLAPYLAAEVVRALARSEALPRRKAAAYLVLVLVTAPSLGISVSSLFWRPRGYEAAVQGTLKQIYAAQMSHRALYGAYADSLGEEKVSYRDAPRPRLDSSPAVADGRHCDYEFIMERHPDDDERWAVVARPLRYRFSGVRSFYIDETGILRGEDVAGSFGGASMLSLSVE